MAEHRPGETIQSLARALGVFGAFDAEHPALTLSGVATRAGLTRASARRALRTLVELGYAELDGALFRLRPRVLELGFAHFADLTLEEVLRPHLEDLAAALQESAGGAVLDGDHVVYVARAAARRTLRAQVRTGTRLPAETTAVGRVLLAGRSPEELAGLLAAMPADRRAAAPHLPDQLAAVREHGYAVVDQELEDGLRSVAVPVRDGAGRTVAAVDVAAAASPGGPSPATHLPELRAAAHAIEADLRPLTHLAG